MSHKYILTVITHVKNAQNKVNFNIFEKIFEEKNTLTGQAQNFLNVIAYSISLH